MHIDELITAASLEEGKQIMVITPDWGQGKTTFGGVSAAMLTSAMSQKVDKSYRLLSLTTSFIKPLLSELEFSIEVKLVKAGKTIAHVEASIIQNKESVVTAKACFGIERTSSIKVLAQRAPDALPPEKGKAFPFIPKVIPEFTKHFDFSLVEGDMPFQGSASKVLAGWMRFREPPKFFSAAHLIALIDAWPPTMLPMLERPAPASTITWTVQLIQGAKVQARDWFFYKASTDFSRNGLGFTSAQIWGQQGELLANSSQAVAIYD